MTTGSYCHTMSSSSPEPSEDWLSTNAESYTNAISNLDHYQVQLIQIMLHPSLKNKPSCNLQQQFLLFSVH